jgi:transposase
MQSVPAIPPEIARRVRAVFGSNHFYLRVGDQLNALLDGMRVANLLTVEHPMITAIPVLAMVTYFQYAESLSDVQAADALRSRLEWKYALHLPVIAPIVSETTLCHYRQELLIDPVARREMGALVRRLASLNYGPSQPGDASIVLASICSLNRLLWLYEAMDEVLEMLARRQPAWLSEIAQPYWYTLYRAVAPLAGNWAGGEAMDSLSLTIGTDIDYLLATMASAGDTELSKQPPIVALARLWAEQFERDDAGAIHLRETCSFCSAGSRRHQELI